MRENATPEYLAAFDEARQTYLDSRHRSPLEALSHFFNAGIRYGRKWPTPPDSGSAGVVFDIGTLATIAGVLLSNAQQITGRIAIEAPSKRKRDDLNAYAARLVEIADEIGRQVERGLTPPVVTDRTPPAKTHAPEF